MKTSSTLNDVSGRDRVRRDTAAHENDDYFRRLIERLPAAVYTCDTSGRVTFFNQAAVTLWGRVPKLGTDLWCGSWRIYRRDGTPLPLEECPLAIALAEGRAVRGQEIVVERPDGSRRIVLAHPEPLRGDDGTVVGAVNMLLDITEGQQAEQALRDSEERFRTVAMNAPAAIYIKDMQGRYTLANPLACQALGQPEGVAGLTDHDLLPSAVADQLRRHDEFVIATGQAVEREEVVERDGFHGDYLSVKFPLFNARGKAVGVCGVSTDITERKRAENTCRASEERFARFMQHLPGLAWIKDASGRYVFANEAASKAFQTSAAELYGKTDAEIFSPEAARQFRENDRRALASEAGIQTVESLKHADGVTHYSLVSKFPIPAPDHGPVLIGGMAIDVTDHRHAEEALRESEERFRTLANHAPVGIFMTAPDGGNVFVNEAWCAMAGLTPGQALGDGWIQAVHPEDRERVVTVWHAAARNGQESVDEFRFQRPDGVITWLQGKAVPIGIPSGEVVGYIGTVADITERISAEQALKEADQRKDEFLAILAHELRNPLAPIRTGLELMRLANDDPALVEEVRATMDRQAQHMARLIDDLLDVSRIMRGVVELRRSRIELSSIVRSAVEAARPIIDDYGHELSIAMPRCPIILDADPTRLAQVISNLLNNASKYMQPGGRIELSAERDECEAVVRVKDWGIGIPAEMHDRIFSMFTQLDRSLDRSHGGLGIGLTLVKRLVEMHGGTVAVFSAGPGQGSEFTVRLPLVAGPTMVHTTADDGNEAASGRRRILVVDDNESAAKVLAMFLKTLGNEVRTAHDGLAALQVAAAFRPDIILLDLGMPKLDGYEAARRIRREPWGKHTVLAALTGWGQEEDRLRTRTAGFDHHFVKPVDPAVLRRLLAEVPASSG